MEGLDIYIRPRFKWKIYKNFSFLPGSTENLKITLNNINLELILDFE